TVFGLLVPLVGDGCGVVERRQRHPALRTVLQRLDDMAWQRGHLGFEELAEWRIGVVAAVAQVQVACHQRRPIQLLNRPSGSYWARARSSLAMASSVANRAGRAPRFSSASWMPVARCDMAAMLDRAQSPYSASSAGSFQEP